MNRLIIEGVKDFNLDHIFDCGQCFRWNKEADGSYTGIAGGRVANISLKGNDLILSNVEVDDFEKFWINYLDIDTDYSKIKEELASRDDKIKEAIKVGTGIRILNQEVWETVISFIISANNNIPRIKGCIENLAENFGEPLGKFRGKKRYAFPTAKTLANLTQDDLVCCSLGYRTKYIINTAKIFAIEGEDYLNTLIGDSASTEETLDIVSRLNGVGPKVANCILLFSMKKRDSFPIDVWMRKVMAYMYGFAEDDIKGMKKFARESFGNNAGIAQQYLFYYMRNKKSEI